MQQKDNTIKKINNKNKAYIMNKSFLKISKEELIESSLKRELANMDP